MSLFDSASLVLTPSGYKEDKLYSIKPTDGSGDLVVTRATTATRVNSDGLIEECPYNLVRYSEDISNSAWAKYNITISANSTTAPNGTLTAEKLLSSNFTSFQGIEIQVNYISGQKYTNSIYFKYIDTPFVQILTPSFVSSNYVNFNIQTGEVVAGVYEDATVTSVGNGWYRCSFTFISNYTGSGGTMGAANLINSASSSRASDFTGDGVKGIYLWGAQLVSGTSAKEYFPTTDRLDVPRLDYTNSSCPSILVEPQRTNICLRSELLATSPWTNFAGTITNNNTTSPDGNVNATLLTNSGSGAGVYQTITSLSTGQTYTVSFYAKLGTATNVCVVINNTIAWNTVGGESFDSSDGLSTSTWTRVKYTFTAPLNINIHIGGHEETGVAAQSSGSFYVWGVQLEQGSYATSYIPTIASSVTRNADVIFKTGISSLIGQTEGTIFIDVYRPTSNSPFIFMSALTTGSGAFANSIYLYQLPTAQLVCDVFVSGVQQASIATSTDGLSVGRHKIAIAYKQNDFVLYIDGIKIGEDTSGNIPSMSCFEINGADISSISNVKTNSAVLFKTRLSNTELATLTTI